MYIKVTYKGAHPRDYDVIGCDRVDDTNGRLNFWEREFINHPASSIALDDIARWEVVTPESVEDVEPKDETEYFMIPVSEDAARTALRIGYGTQYAHNNYQIILPVLNRLSHQEN